ncbi:MAG TPA: DUF1552 domain-containing protein [Steroidobacteraceae bacterium]|nr:DUF1552 domain-containing protein [Steroidobacteraceae bacterium]
MFISKKHISRRTVLRGVGASVALPLLDAMVPAGTALAKTAAAPQMKLAFVYFPHGAIMFPDNDQWTPQGIDREFKLSTILQPLEPFQKQLIVVTNLGNKPAESAAVHAIVPGTWLSCVHPRESQDPYGGVTIDQMAAQHIGQDTPLPSLEVKTEGAGGGGSCDRAYGCSYSGTIAFRKPTMPLPMEYNPRTVFQRLFGRGDTPEERRALGQQYDSILDMVSEDAASLKTRLGPRDQAVLADYLDSVREIERRMQKMEHQDLSQLKLPAAPIGIPDRFPEQQALIFDLIALAFQAHLTRIATMMMAAEVSNMTYPFIGVPDAFHPVSHHQGDPVKIAKLVKIQTYHSQKLAAFLKRLAATADGDGSMLDHSIIVYGSNMANSNAHNQYPLPTAIVGGGCGAIKGGQHLKYPEHTPLANVWLTLMQRIGMPIEKLGDSTGTIAEI